MTSTITCPHCGLAQEPASDSVCRGCANPIAGVVAPAKSVLGLGKAVAAKALPLGARVAGVVLLLNAGANVLSMIKEGAGTGPLANQEVKGMIVDLVVGGGLLAGRATLQKWAIVRVVLGLIVFGAMFGAQHDMTSLTLQAGFSAALLLLLVGDAGKARIGAGAGLSVAYLLLATAGVMQTWTGSNPAAAALLTSKGDISPAAGRLKGEKFDYCLSVPEQHWYLRAPQLASRDNPSSDRWLTRPDLDAHVMIMGEAVEPTLRINQDKFERAVIDEMKGRLTKFENLGREPLPGGAMLHLRGHAKTLDLEYYRGLFAYGNRGYQVVAFATPKSFARAEPELAAMVRSFQPACQGRPVTAR
ncbi:MAG: hypothetical protein E6J58_21855 [Deltaproteobacteria bacterium]|nr:MAG: hypothetical protein E6J58_21855 [Deltaproteobacteria bacterium]